MACPYKHTKFQPGNEEADKKNWFCPRCGVGYEGPGGQQGLIIAASVNESDPVPEGMEPCTLIHNDDEIICYVCDYSASGAVAMRAIAKKLDLVTCPTCKGHGMVPLDPASEITATG